MTKKNKKQTKPIENKKPKVNWEKKFKEAEKINTQLQMKIMQLDLEKKQQIKDFQDKAKSFETKASEKLEELKDNLNKKFENDTKENKLYGSQKILEDIIPILFNIEIAIKAGQNQGSEVQAYVKGFEMLLDQLYTSLENLGVQFIIPKVGDKYNPELHQALESNGEDTTIVEVKKKGIKLHKRVLYPAIVILGK